MHVPSLGSGAPMRRRSTRRPGLGLAALHVGCLALAITATPLAADGTRGRVTREYDLKAAFLFNFTQFVEWPAAALADPQAPFVIGVLGDDPFGSSLDEIVANENVHGHAIVVRRGRTLSELGACQLLFVSRSQAPRLRGILDGIAGRSVLVVGDMDEFAAHGGTIGFVTSGSRLRLVVNMAQARDAGLTISSKLLRQAELIDIRP
jgi:hypothetical protein